MSSGHNLFGGWSAFRLWRRLDEATDEPAREPSGSNLRHRRGRFPLQRYSDRRQIGFVCLAQMFKTLSDAPRARSNLPVELLDGELSRQCSRAPIRVVEFTHQLLGPASDGERSRSTHNAEYSSATPAHPLRSATIGSTPAARRAGIAEASSAATASSTAASRSMTGSQNLTPKS
jgi:hypothetical protein